MSTRFQRWFGKLFRQARKIPARVRPRHTRFNLEHLEDRLAPATFNVNSLADILNPPAGVVTLRSAIEAANATPGGNTINLIVSGIYKITIPGANEDNNATGDFDILPTGGNLSIVNTSGGAVTVDGNHLDRVFDINPGFDPANPTPSFTVTMQGFTITNGNASPGDFAPGSGGGIRDQGNASLTLTNMVLTNNRATADGGGVSMENMASVPWTLTLNNTIVSNNHAGDAGGGVETDGSGKVFLNAGTTITGNTCVNQGAGVWLDFIPDPNNPIVLKSANLTVTGSTISNNKALTGLGGGIGNAGTGAVSIIGSTLSSNFAGMAGGGFADQNGQGSLYVATSTFTNNVAVGDGGAIAESGPTTITSTDIDGNSTSGNGGGIFSDGYVNLTNSTVANNSAAGTGGGFADDNTQGTLNTLGDLFANNVATGNGGAIAAGGQATSIATTEFDGNSSGGSGGAVFVNGTTLVVQSSTFANNTSAGNGGGVEIDTNGTSFFGSSITNSTLTGNDALNSAGATGGGIDAGSGFTGTLLLLNDTLNGNFAEIGGGIFWAGTAGSAVGVENTIIAGNIAAIGPDAASPLLFTATLNGAQQVPPVATVATGSGSILLSADETTITTSSSFSGLATPPSGAHLHIGPAGTKAIGGLPLDGNGNPTTNGDGIALDAFGNPIEFTPLPASTSGTLGPQTFLVLNGPGQFVPLLMAGDVYENIHDLPFFPAGEIRGQYSFSTGVGFTDLGGNLIGIAGPTGGNSGFTAASTQTGTLAYPLDPLLGPLSDNSGPTIGGPGQTQALQTEPLLTGSPALAKGILTGAPTVDERGVPRGLNGTIDVGAVETSTAALNGVTFPNGFAGSTSLLTYNSSAKINGNVAELTDGGFGEVGSVFTTNAQDITHFTNQFTFQLSAGASAGDGFTFTIQGVGPTALGGGGGGLGYAPPPGQAGASIGNSAAIKFDLINNAGEGNDSTGLYTNGAEPTVPSIDLTSSGVNLHSGDIFQVNMSYDGATLLVVITDTVTHQSASQSYSINLPAVLGSPTAYVGFTAATGATAAVQNILTWTYDPPTGPIALVAAGHSALVLSPAPLAVGTAGAAYQQTLTASGGTGNLTLTVTGVTGSIAGLTLPASGTNSLTISGKPAASGTVTFTVKVTDANNDTTVQTRTFTINPAVVLSPTTLSQGTATIAYNQTISASGGTGDKTLTVTGVTGSIAGLTLPASGTNSLTISGKPLAAGKVTFTVTATDANNAVTVQTYTITINSIVTLNLTTLANGKVGKDYNETLTALGGTGNKTFTVTNVTGSIPGLTLPTSGTNSLTISGKPSAAGSLHFTVTVTDENGDVFTKKYTLTIKRV